MPLSLLPSLLLQILIVGYTPGPANLFALSCAHRYGRRKAMKMWAGMFAGFSIAAVTMAVLTHFLGAMMGRYVIYLKFVGAAYIVYLASKIARNPMTSDSGDGECSFKAGFIVQITNAKMILFDLSVFSAFVLPYSSRLSDLLLMCLPLLIAGPGANFTWIAAGSILEKIDHKYHRAIDIAMSIALLICALLIVV